MNKVILISAAGEGTRFKAKGVLTPKPLIRVQGKSLLEYTLESFKLSKGDCVVIAFQVKHKVDQQLNSSLEHKLNNRGVGLKWIKIDKLLPGQLSTSAYACNELTSNLKQLKNHQLWIHNCDTGFQWSHNLSLIHEWASMPVFEAEGGHWSFGMPDAIDGKRAIQIAEKKRISNLASIGLYGFRSITSFCSEAELFLKNEPRINNEYYIAPMLQKAIESNKMVTLPRVCGVKLYGTPDELCATFGINLEKLRLENNSSSLSR
ncbi:hypothetical protein [Prochlorococcus marinus]|uniref:hypothetical protein n=1 Tax=Prochlorococcus marinus TaxID=1219 RepID=UPI0007B3BE30|nr:hypothetical protein [Prochlorococcus marinus]KZR73262.1 2-C-methyl-D-erythritol 4-phosphate cytidylyltransferase [Prochlorococcus marinus str. MIT 1320]